MTASPTVISFGFLPHKCVIEFGNGKITPISEFDRVAKAVKKRLHEDGHLYPTVLPSVIVVSALGRKTPRTRRPAHLYQVPPSHNLYIAPQRHESNIREGSAGFVIHLLGFLFRTRLQFADWFYDGRIPVDFTGTFALARDPIQAGNYISNAYETWSNWPEVERTRFTNILYMHSRVSAYEWDWEQFTLEYMILDACWKMGQKLFKLHAKTNADRIPVLCKAMGVEPHHLGIDLKTMTDLRNDLFHEGLWYKARPGSVGRRPFYIHAAMGALCKELILALIGRGEK